MSITMKNVTFAYGTTRICEKLGWSLPESGVVCLWGPSGCGKTTLLRLLAGLEKPQSGVIEPSGYTVSMVFQEDRLLPWLTVRQNAALACNDTVRVDTLLDAVGLADYADSTPDAISGGQQRRVALVRALAADSDLLLLDEPFTGLDEETKALILPLIRESATKKPVVLVTHIAAEAEALGAAMIPLSGLPLTGELAQGKN